MKLDPGEGIQNAMIRHAYEPEQTEWLKETLGLGDVFVDVGANFGYFTGLASIIVGRSGHVFAFEPSPVASDVIASTIQTNRIRNVTLTRAAVGDRSGSESIYMPVGDSVHSPSAFFSDEKFVPLKVPLIALDEFAPLQALSQIQMVKIDVEGYEPNVIAGLKGLATSGKIQNLWCEFNSGWLRRNDTTPRELFDLILSLGFEVRRSTAIATHPERDGTPYQLQDCWFVHRTA